MLLAIPALAMTRVQFRADPGVWPEPGEWAALAEKHTHAALLQVEDAQELKAYPSANSKLELAKWQQQAAVKQVWQKTAHVYDYSPSEQFGAVQEMLGKIVPGLTVSFKEIFDAFGAAGCPVWLIGGTVRDLLAKSKPNDVDTAILCDSRVVKRVCTQKGWMHSPEDHVTDPYFSVGIAHGENEEYLEGFAIDLVMKDPFTPETTVNMLFWSVKESFVLDPSNFGVSDAANKVLRPAAPPKELVAHGTTWSTWRQWILGSFSGPQHMRHNRYLKMRMRGWTPVRDTLTQPAESCFQFFMGNQIATLLPLEGQMPERVIDPRTMLTRTGDQQPMVPAATLFFMQEKPATMDAAKAKTYVEKFLDVLLEDLEAYYALPRAEYQACTGSRTALVAKEQRAVATSATELVRTTLIEMCVNPPMHAIVMARPEVFAPPGVDAPPANFERACKDLVAAFNARTGETRAASDFRLPGVAPSFFHTGPSGVPSSAQLGVLNAIPSIMPYLEPYWTAYRTIRPAVQPQFLPQIVQLAPMPQGPIRDPVFTRGLGPQWLTPQQPMVRTSHAAIGPGGFGIDPRTVRMSGRPSSAMVAPMGNPRMLPPGVAPAGQHLPTLGHIPAHAAMPAHGGFGGVVRRF